MAKYDWIEVQAPTGYSPLADVLDDVFEPEAIAQRLDTQVTSRVKFVLVEHGYVDKDYRSTLYNFYAKKSRAYRRDCVRLHFFDEWVKFDKERTNIVCTQGSPRDHYFGYIVLRPTLTATLGRSVLSPDIRVAARGLAIQSEHQVNVLGHKLPVRGFPSMAQPADIAVCAHVSCWAILRYYSESSRQHKEYLIHDMARLASSFDPGGLVPSLGLNVLEAERVFQSAGCFPLIVTKRRNAHGQVIESKDFYEQLLAYLESGFPLFVEISSRQHAVVAVGYNWGREDTVSGGESVHVWARVDTLLMVDDNKLPYRSVPAHPEVEIVESTDYSAKDFDRFIVALPEKIHFPAEAVDALSIRLAKGLQKGRGVSEKDVRLRRYFMTTISELRVHARKNESYMGEVLVRLLMEMESAQYVWVVEFCSPEQWESGHVRARAIVDATASKKDPVATLLLHDDQLAFVFDRSSGTERHEAEYLERDEGVPLPRMELNLRRVVES